MKEEIIMNNEKMSIINFLWKNNIVNLQMNELDSPLKKTLSKQYFGKRNLFEIYASRGFNYHCQIGSFICCLNLPFSCSLIRGELLSNIGGKRFVHGWIEVIYNGEEYVIDTSFAKAIPKKIYYKVFSPKVFQSLVREDLFINKYALYLKKILTRENDLSLEKVYSAWWQYEDSWLTNIDDNTSFNNKVRAIPVKKSKVLK